MRVCRRDKRAPEGGIASWKQLFFTVMDQPAGSVGEGAGKAGVDLGEKPVDSDVHMVEAESVKAERSVSGSGEKSEGGTASELHKQVYLPPDPGAPAFSVMAPHRRPIAYDEYETDNGSSRILYLRSVLPTQPVLIPPGGQYRMPTSGGDAHFDEEERRRAAVKADAKRKELRAASVLPYTLDFKKALGEYLEQRGIHLEVVHDNHSANRTEAASKGLPYRCSVWWYQQPNGGGRVDFDGGYQSDERVAVQAAAHAAITLKGIPLDDLLEKHSSSYGNSIIPATTARLKEMLPEGGEGEDVIQFKKAKREADDGGEQRTEYQYTAKVPGWAEENKEEFVGGWHVSAMDAKNDSCQKVWSEIEAKEQAKRDREVADRLAKEREEREAKMREQLEKDREMREKLAKEQKEKMEREREARIKAAPVRTSAVAASYSEKRQLGQSDGGGMPDKRQRVAAPPYHQQRPPMPGGGSTPRREPLQQQQQQPLRPYPSPLPSPYQQRQSYGQQQQQRPPMQQQQPTAQPPTAAQPLGMPMPRPGFGSYGSPAAVPQWQQQQQQHAGPTMMSTPAAAAYQSRSPLPTQPYAQSSRPANTGMMDMASRAAQMSAAASYYGQQAVKQQPTAAAAATTAAVPTFGRHAAMAPTPYPQQPSATTPLSAAQYPTPGQQQQYGINYPAQQQQQQAPKQQQASGGLGVYGGASSSSSGSMPYAGIYGQQQQQQQQQQQAIPASSAQPGPTTHAGGGGPPYAGQAVKATSSLEEYAAALATYQKQMAEYAAKCSAYYAQQHQRQQQQ
ncbi:hypothetical protein FOZ61_001452 [Perkinsus olseni]|uniref:Uncharacterized protein n=1 Tax=Perkinsus olseni TaxID=32597 RepID=A0A7J6LXZ4_PEROL|nr:hypothetical protein FOZ61_001452 [Perkinsus olseni]